MSGKPLDYAKKDDVAKKHIHVDKIHKHFTRISIEHNNHHTLLYITVKKDVNISISVSLTYLSNVCNLNN